MNWKTLDLGQVVKQAIAQLFEHGLVLFLHALLRHGLRLIEGIRCALRRKNGAFDEKVRRDDRPGWSRVLGLDMKQPSGMTNIVVIAEERRTL
jgi:hypothetical protein